MKKLLVLVVCLFAFCVSAFALPDISQKQLPQFKIDAQNVLNTVNLKPTCAGNKTYKKFVTDLFDEDRELYLDFSLKPTNSKKVQYSDKFLDDSSTLQGASESLFDDFEILFKKYGSVINYDNVSKVESQNTFDFLYLMFKKYNIEGYNEFKELLSLIEDAQNSILDWKEQIEDY